MGEVADATLLLWSTETSPEGSPAQRTMLGALGNNRLKVWLEHRWAGGQTSSLWEPGLAPQPRPLATRGLQLLCYELALE